MLRYYFRNFCMQLERGFKVFQRRYIRVRMKSSFKDGIESFGIRFERKKEVWRKNFKEQSF